MLAREIERVGNKEIHYFSSETTGEHLQYDLIIADVNFPELIDDLAKKEGCKFVVSGYSIPTNLAHLKGKVHLLRKPIRRNSIAQVLSEMKPEITVQVLRVIFD